MAYSELIKNFNKVRDYMRDFYVYGFKSRENFTKKSLRTYDDDRRRIESWLGDYMRFRQDADGKTVFLSIDSRRVRHNPLYLAWKTKSFTDGALTLHFLILDILSDGGERSLTDIAERVDTYLESFADARVFDLSTIRKKLNEYVKLGLLTSRKSGKTMFYRRAEAKQLPDQDVLDFFSEAAPCGVIGSFLLDQKQQLMCENGGQSSEVERPHPQDHFAFKHHYMTGTMDSEVLCELFAAMREKRGITFETVNRHKKQIVTRQAIPLRVMSSVQSGRQYVMAYVPRYRRITSFRLDHIISVQADEVCEQFDKLRETLDSMQQHMWGVSTDSRSGERMEHISFTVRYGEDEQYIRNRLEREKRIGTVEHIDAHTSRFTADVFDASELIPWVRTFICRITDLSISNQALEQQFRGDLRRMYEMYGLEGSDAFS